MLLSPLANVRSFGNALFVRASPTQVLLIVIVTTVTVVILTLDTVKLIYKNPSVLAIMLFENFFNFLDKY